MPSETERWQNGPLRNTIGHTEGPTGAVTGGVSGHVKAELREVREKEEQKPREVAADPSRYTGAGLP